MLCREQPRGAPGGRAVTPPDCAAGVPLRSRRPTGREKRGRRPQAHHSLITQMRLPAQEGSRSPAEEGVCGGSRQQGLQGWAAAAPCAPPAPPALCPPPLSGAAGRGAERCCLVPGDGSAVAMEMAVSGGARWGQERDGMPWGHTAAAAWVHPHPRPRAGPWHWGGGSRHPPVRASASALPARACARVCMHGCMQACGCAAERACACKRVCVRERACTAAGARGHAGQRWGGCVALPARGRGWRARCGQGEGMHHPTDHLMQRLPEPAGCWRAVRRGRAGTAVESCRQGSCSYPACNCLRLPAGLGAAGAALQQGSNLQPPALLLERIHPGNVQGRPRLQPVCAPLCHWHAVPAQPALVLCLSFPIPAVLAGSQAGGCRGQAPC